MIYVGLLLFIVLEYVRPGTYFPPINWIRLNTLVPLGVILGSLFLKGKLPKPSVLGELNTQIILFLLGMIGFSVLLAEVTMYAFTVFTTVLGYALIFWVIARELQSFAQIKGVLTMLIAVHVVLAALTPQMFLSPGMRHYIASGTFLRDGNDFALSVDIAIPFCLFLLFESRRIFAKGIWLGVLALLIFCVVATQSRGGTMALVAVGVYYWLKSNRKLMTGALATAAVVAVLTLAPGNYFQRMNSISNYEDDGSAQGRITAWKAGTRMALYNPLGVGAGQFPSNYTRYAPGETRWKTAHSIYFLILGELGFLGLGTLLFFIVSNIVVNGRLLRQLKRRAQSPEVVTASGLLACLSASVMAYAVAGAFLSATYYPHMFMLAGLLVAARRLARTAGSAEVETAQPATPAVVCHPAIRATLGGRRAS